MNQLLKFFDTDEPQQVPVVEYKLVDGIYHLYTISTAAVKELRRFGVKMRLEINIYVGKSKNLPKDLAIEINEHRVNLPTDATIKTLEEKYEKYLRMMNAFRAMEKEIVKQEIKIVDFLLKNGIKLKIGSPMDSQIFIAKMKTRLHYQQSMRKSINEDALEKLAKKDPELAKCFDKEVINVVNEERLLEVLAKKSSIISSAIIEHIVGHSFVETKIFKHNSTKCKYCGGKKAKLTNECQKCGAK